MNLLTENIKQFVGQTVKVCVNHKVYGKQDLTIRKFQPLCDDNKVGFMVGKQEIFVYTDEIENIEIYENVCIIQGTMQDMVIEKI